MLGIELRMCFFFQAEDGIRDTSVTGVQTCALPILHAPWGFRRVDGGRPGYKRVSSTLCTPSTACNPARLSNGGTSGRGRTSYVRSMTVPCLPVELAVRAVRSNHRGRAAATSWSGRVAAAATRTVSDQWCRPDG